MKKAGTFILIIAGIILVLIYISDEDFKRIFTVPCSSPISYTIGEVSPLYGLSKDTLKTMLQEIDQAWSTEAKKDLFTYRDTDANNALAVNILYDDQQRFLDKAESTSSRIEYEKLSYKAAKEEIERMEKEYEETQQEYKELLLRYDRMQQEPSATNRKRRELAKDIEIKRRELNRQADRLNEKVAAANRISSRINDMIADYNADYGTTGEFNQGDYQKDARGERINIYGYRDLDELKLVLAHEMGHALGLGHVQNPESIMFYLMKEQPTDQLTFSSQDAAALNERCGS